MREIKIDDVREGDVARSNGKELLVVGVSPTGYLVRCEGCDQYTFEWSPEALAVLGVTFWREERKLPNYPGAVVASGDGHRVAVRARDRGESFAPWITTAIVPWKTETELLDWLGPDWRETTTTTMPTCEWVQVSDDQIRDGDVARFEWPDGSAAEGLVSVYGDEVEIGEFDITVSTDDPGKWFKREER